MTDPHVNLPGPGAIADGALAALAHAHGVATSYVGADDEEQHPPAASIRAVLTAMGVACADDGEVAASLAEVGSRRWQRWVAETVVLRDGGPRRVRVVGPAGTSAWATIELEDGGVVELAAPGRAGGRRTVDGVELVEGEIDVPDDVPIGAHRLVVEVAGRADDAHLLVVPDRCPGPAATGWWGWQVQLYALRSERSWGIGDLADLERLVGFAGRDHRADFVLLNPLHAAAPVTPREPSPYSPASRRAFDPIYLRPERCHGWDAALAGPDGTRLHQLADAARGLNTTARIDRDAVFARKDEALRLVWRHARSDTEPTALVRFRADHTETLVDVAVGLACTQRFGEDRSTWPVSDELDPELADEVEYQTWLQWQLDDQLRSAQAEARDAGMRIGVITDLAVGVDPDGVDVWSLGDDLAAGITVGAPPDALAQLGQDWGLPPLRPDRLAASGYAAFRQIVRANLRAAGGLRIDHVMGLWRLFWIPAGAGAGAGTYVEYDADAMLGALALEAHRAGAVVVGEDLGTVPPGLREQMDDRGVLGSAVFWFERSGAAPNRRARSSEYRRSAMTSVTTHDLATIAGWLADEPTRVRAALHQLARSEAAERAERATERAEILDLLGAEGRLAPGERADAELVAEAIHAFVAATPSTLVAISLADALGDLRQPNLPGTVDEYPNWRLPIAIPDSDGDDAGTDGLLPPSRPVSLDDVLAHPRVAATADLVARVRREVTHG